MRECKKAWVMKASNETRWAVNGNNRSTGEGEGRAIRAGGHMKIECPSSPHRAPGLPPPSRACPAPPPLRPPSGSSCRWARVCAPRVFESDVRIAPALLDREIQHSQVCRANGCCAPPAPCTTDGPSHHRHAAKIMATQLPCSERAKARRLGRIGAGVVRGRGGWSEAMVWGVGVGEAVGGRGWWLRMLGGNGGGAGEVCGEAAAAKCLNSRQCPAGVSGGRLCVRCTCAVPATNTMRSVSQGYARMCITYMLEYALNIHLDHSHDCSRSSKRAPQAAHRRRRGPRLYLGGANACQISLCTDATLRMVVLLGMNTSPRG